MEVLYTILTILFLVAVIFLMVMLFKGKSLFHFPTPPHGYPDDYVDCFTQSICAVVKPN